MRSKRLDLSLLLAVEALRSVNTFEARDSLYNVLQEWPGILSILHVPGSDIKSAEFSPDGKIVAGLCSAWDGGLVLWDVATRKRLADGPLGNLTHQLLRIRFSPDGKVIAAIYDRTKAGNASGASGVELWDVATRRLLSDERLNRGNYEVINVIFSPDSKTVAVAGDHGVALWNVARREPLAVELLTVKDGSFWSLAFSPDGKIIAAGLWNAALGNGVVLWDVATAKLR